MLRACTSCESETGRQFSPNTGYNSDEPDVREKNYRTEKPRLDPQTIMTGRRENIQPSPLFPGQK